MSDKQGFIKMINEFATSLKKNAAEIDQNAEDIEFEVLKILNILLAEDKPSKMKVLINDVLDKINLDELFSQFDLQAQMGQIVKEIEKNFEKLGLQLDDFPPTPLKILSALPNVIPENLINNLPNLESQLQEIIDIFSSEEVQFKFKKVTKEVPKRPFPLPENTGETNTIPSILDPNAEKETSPIEAFEVLFAETFKEKTELFERIIDKIEEIIDNSGFISELEEKIAPLLGELTSKEFTISKLLIEVTNLVKELAPSALVTVRLLLDVLFDEMTEILEFVKNKLELPQTGLFAEVFKTLFPRNNFTTLSIPALTAATPFTLFSQPSISQEEGIITFNSIGLYGGAQLVKGLLALTDMINKLSPKTKGKRGAISDFLAIFDVVTNFVAQLVSAKSAVDFTEKEDTTEARLNTAIWSFQLISALIWPIVMLLSKLKDFDFLKKEITPKRQVAGTLILEIIHWALFIWLSSSPEVKTNNKLANIIDPLPGIIGAGILFDIIKKKERLLTASNAEKKEIKKDIKQIEALQNAVTLGIQVTYGTLVLTQDQPDSETTNT